jgi:hypothetical protein
MPRGRPAVGKAPTKFLNSKRRVIYMTADGKYVAKSEKGSTVYNPKARFVKSPGGTERNVANSSARVPTAIRAKAVRKVRANRGKARAPRMYKMGVMAAYKHPIGPKRAPGRPRKYRVSPGGNMGLAKLFGGKPVRKERKRHEGLPIPRKRKAKKSPLARLIASLN